MRLRSIRLTNIRRFAGQTLSLDGLGDGITVLCEPNEFGKSTIFDALHALFFERHRSQKQAVKSLQSHAGGTPEVGVEVELSDGRFLIEKRWLSRATARISSAGRIIAQEDEAEAWIDALLGTGIAGPSGLLWVRQGVTGLEADGTSAAERSDRERGLTARRDLLSSVAGEIDMMTGGRRLDAVMARVNADLARIATATGRPKAGGEWARLIDEVAELDKAVADLAGKAARLSGSLARRSAVQRELAELDDPDAERRRSAALKSAEESHGEALRHAERLAEADRAQQLAALAREGTEAKILRLQTLADRATGATAALADAQCKAEDAGRRRDRLEAEHRAAADLRDRAEEAARLVRGRLDAARQARLARAARERAQALRKTLERAEELRGHLEKAGAQRSLLTVTADSLRAAEDARDAHDRLLAQSAAQGVSITFRYQGTTRASRNGTALSEGPHRLTGPASFTLPGIGDMNIDPGAGQQDNLTTRTADAARHLAGRLAACGATSLAEARERLAQARNIDADLRATGDVLAALAPEGIETLRAALLRAEAEAAGADKADEPEPRPEELAEAESLAANARDAATTAHARAIEAGNAQAGAASTLDAASRTCEAARAEAGDLALLADQMRKLSTELAAQAGYVARAVAEHQALRDSAPDLETTAAALARARSVATQARAARDCLRGELATLNGSIDALADEGIEESLEELRGRRDIAAQRAERHAAEVAALSRLRVALDDARKQARDAYFGPVLRELEPLLAVLHPGATLQIDDRTLLPAVLTRDGQPEALEILSGGTREQVAILTRLAFARLFASTGQSVPVILDDALIHSDDDRIEAMFTALHRVAREQQIIVLTCRQRAFAALGGDRARAVIQPA